MIEKEFKHELSKVLSKANYEKYCFILVCHISFNNRKTSIELIKMGFHSSRIIKTCKVIEQITFQSTYSTEEVLELITKLQIK